MVSGVIKTFSKIMLLCTACATTALATPNFPDTGGRPVSEFLPEGVTFNPDIPTPESFLGADVGTWHVRHDQLVGYMYALAEASDRITIEETGRTHENRPLLLLTITAAENRPHLEEMRQAHLDVVNSGANQKSDAPLVYYLGYSIHGNEPSGSNASLIVAYYLAAAQSQQVQTLLKNNIVLLDPSFNPDGLSRFAQWANMHKSKNLVADSQSREHQEGWPSGRTNHYWFDLNRDWLLLTHPESQARIKQFQKWRPHILTDHHEMGPDSTFFFQPGVPSRKNPNTPDGNVRLTEALADFHAKALDEDGQLYFSEEGFDDFYYGKGSSYPDSMGSIGILFEQASSRGHLQDTINGELAFADTIQNHVTTSLSTLEGGVANKPAILDYQSSFYKETADAIGNDDTFGVVVDLPKNDNGRVQAMLAILEQHNIKHSFSTETTEINDTEFAAGSLVVPFNQPRYRLVKSLFSTRQSFPENTFYDVSNWNIALAFNLDYATLTKRQGRGLETNSSSPSFNHVSPVSKPAYAYAFSWQDYFAPSLLQALLEKGVKVRSAESAFTATLDNGQEKRFAAGSIVIPSPLEQPDQLASIIDQAAANAGVQVFSIKSGLTSRGSDLGSRNMLPVTLPKVLLVGGEGTYYAEVGEIWHYLDTRVGMGPTLTELEKLGGLDLSDYTHIVFASGRYDQVDAKVKTRLSEWIDNGGVIIGEKSAVSFFAQEKWIDAQVTNREKINAAFPDDDLRYADKRALAASKIIAGAVYLANIDDSHPLFYGYEGEQLPFFKTSNMIIKTDSNPFVTPATYTDKPLQAGYSAKQLEEMIAGSTAVIAAPKGKGLVVGLTDNVLFRGYWYGTGKLMANAIYQTVHLTR